MEMLIGYAVFGAGWMVGLYVAAMGLRRGGRSYLRRYGFSAAGFWIGMVSYWISRELAPIEGYALGGVLTIWVVIGLGIWLRRSSW
jgi:hypothetical protein